MTAIRSDIARASSWSCVTYTNVVPSSAWIRLQLELHLLAQLHVERAERLVEQQGGRAVDERPRQCDPLLLAARELRRPRAARALPARTISSISATRVRCSPLGTFFRRRPKATLSPIVMCGKSA